MSKRSEFAARDEHCRRDKIVTWTKTGDDFPDRLLFLTSDAYRLHHAALTYCNRLSTDGYIKSEQLRFVPVPARVSRGAVVRELVEASLWLVASDGWEIRNFLTDQPSAEEVQTNRRYGAARQRVRFAKTDADKLVRKREEQAAREAHHAAMERRRERASEGHPEAASSAPSRSDSRRESHRESRRPVPSRPTPPPSEGEGDATLMSIMGTAESHSSRLSKVDEQAVSPAQRHAGDTMLDEIRRFSPEFTPSRAGSPPRMTDQVSTAPDTLGRPMVVGKEDAAALLSVSPRLIRQGSHCRSTFAPRS